MNEINYDQYFDKIGLCGAGGGVRATEILGGMLQAMTTFSCQPDFMWLTSGAALSGPVYYSSPEMKQSMLPWFKANPIEDILIPYYWIATACFGKPLYDNDKLLEVMRKQLGDVIYENVIVTITDTVTRDTLYVPADWQTAVASSSIPKVFKGRTLFDKNWYKRIPEQEDNCPVTTKIEYVNKQKVFAADGGIYDLIPMVDLATVDRLRHLFIVLPCTDTIPESIHNQSTIGQALSWMVETMEREYREVVTTWGNHPKVTILKSKPYRSGMLSWSKNFGLFEHSYKYACNVLSKLNL